MTSSVQQVGKTIVNSSDCLASHNVVFMNARRNAARWELNNNVEKMVEVQTLCRMSNSGVVQSLLKRTWNLLPGTVQACDIFLPTTETEQLKRKLSHLGQIVIRKNREFIAHSGASPHIMTKNEPFFGEKDTTRRSKEPTVITTANGKAESAEKGTVCVNDWDVSGSANSFYYAKKRRLPWVEKRETPSLIKKEKK